MLKDYENEILIRMFDKGVIGMDYTSVERIASKIKWSDIAVKYRVKKSFQSIIRDLASKLLVSDHGKSGRVASVTKLGVDYVHELKKTREKFV
ncbi:MAG: hypothetical protein HYW23_01770 [Candidatus Aenigmarchaeota archaeon]|nr:hypothetical protein [Candidatus Aenigmarchaeota archaeon]